MDPITFSSAFIHGTGIKGTAFGLGPHADGLVYGPNGPQLFSFSDNGFLGKIFNIAGHVFGLKRDVISRVPLGAQSDSVFYGGRPMGFIGQNPLSPGYVAGGNLSPQCATGLGSALGRSRW
jgi:hypothetical protein